jgi:hypothetical protein
VERRDVDRIGSHGAEDGAGSIVDESRFAFAVGFAKEFGVGLEDDSGLEMAGRQGGCAAASVARHRNSAIRGTTIRMYNGDVTGLLPALRQDGLYDVAADVGEAVVAAGMAEGELGMVEPQGVEDGRVEIVDVTLVLRDLQAEIVGLPVRDAGLHPAAGEPA